MKRVSEIIKIIFVEKRNSIILIPSYQPEETLVILSKGLKDRGFEVLIVDDGSGPKYQDIFERCKVNATVLGYETNQGKGYALKYGYRYIIDHFSSYNGVITADGDGQHRILDIVKVDEKLNAHNVTIIGDRSFDVKIPIKSKIGNAMSQFTQSLATYRYLHDNQCGLRGFLIKDLPLMVKIKGNRYEYEMNVLSALQLREIPYLTMRVETIYEENNKTTHFRPVMDTLLIQSSILLSGLVNVICFLLQAALSFLLYEFVLTNPSIQLRVELCALIAFGGSLLLHIFKSNG